MYWNIIQSIEEGRLDILWSSHLRYLCIRDRSSKRQNCSRDLQNVKVLVTCMSSQLRCYLLHFAYLTNDECPNRSDLCNLCSTVLSVKALEEDIPHHTSIEALFESSKNCHLCLLAWDEFLNKTTDDSSPVRIDKPQNFFFSFHQMT